MFREDFINLNIGNEQLDKNKPEDFDIDVEEVSEARKFLENESVIKAVKEPEFSEISYNGEKFSDLLEKYIANNGLAPTDRKARYFKALVSYLESPTISDTFGATDLENQARRKWKKELYDRNQEAGNLYLKNKLRANNLSPIKTLIEMNYADNPKRSKLIQEIHDLGFKGYLDLPLDKKNEIIKRMDELARDILIEGLN
jgi:hypothetical protein